LLLANQLFLHNWLINLITKTLHALKTLSIVSTVDILRAQTPRFHKSVTLTKISFNLIGKCALSMSFGKKITILIFSLNLEPPLIYIARFIALLIPQRWNFSPPIFLKFN
jgi:hypothetical protein